MREQWVELEQTLGMPKHSPEQGPGSQLGMGMEEGPV